MAHLQRLSGAGSTDAPHAMQFKHFRHIAAALAAAVATRAAQESELGAARTKLQELIQTKL